MTTPDQSARVLRDAIERQRIQRETAQETAREIARERQTPTETTESDMEEQ